MTKNNDETIVSDRSDAGKGDTYRCMPCEHLNYGHGSAGQHICVKENRRIPRVLGKPPILSERHEAPAWCPLRPISAPAPSDGVEPEPSADPVYQLASAFCCSVRRGLDYSSKGGQHTGNTPAFSLVKPSTRKALQHWADEFAAALKLAIQPSRNPERLDGWPDGSVEWPITVNMIDQDVTLADEAQARDLHDTLTRVLKLSR